MNANTEENEKFFKELSEEKEKAEEDFMSVELAKSSSALGKPAVQIGERARQNHEAEGQLTLDVFQTPHEIVVESAIAGVRPEDIDISATNDSIAIRGERTREIRVKEEDYFYHECYWGKFSRSITLPEEVDSENAEVNFKNGILTIRLPKLNKKKSKKLKVKEE